MLERILIIIFVAWLLLTLLSSIGPLVHTLLILAVILFAVRLFFGSGSNRKVG